MNMEDDIDIDWFFAKGLKLLVLAATVCFAAYAGSKTALRDSAHDAVMYEWCDSLCAPSEHLVIDDRCVCVSGIVEK